MRKLQQNLGWAIGYNALALPIAAGVFEPSIGLVLRPEIAALSMSGSSLILAVNAVLLKRLRLPTTVGRPAPARIESMNGASAKALNFAATMVRVQTPQTAEMSSILPSPTELAGS